MKIARQTRKDFPADRVDRPGPTLLFQGPARRFEFGATDYVGRTKLVKVIVVCPVAGHRGDRETQTGEQGDSNTADPATCSGDQNGALFWGHALIFQSHDINIGWDGYIRGTLAAQGVYLWKVTLVYKNGSPESLAGDITLLWKRAQ